MRIDIFSDVICPWCYVGKRRLERALAARPEVAQTAEIRWRAFQLNPDMPEEGIERDLYLRLKFGPSATSAEVYRNVSAVGTEEGIAFNFPAIRRTPNTVEAHRLIRFAGGHSLQDPLVEGLFQAYFLAGRDIGQRETLLEVAEQAGLPAAETRAYLESDTDSAAVRSEDQQARAAGISGVPCFIIDGHYALPGAQPPEALLQLFDLAREGDEGPRAQTGSR